MFHSRGMVQSNTGVPEGTSWIVERDPARDRSERLPEPVAGDAPADGIQLRDETVHGLPAAASCRRRERVSLTATAPGPGGWKSGIGAVALGHDGLAGCGQEIPNAGSSHRTPRAASGSWYSDIW